VKPIKHSGADWMARQGCFKSPSALGVKVADILGQVYLGIYHISGSVTSKKVDWQNDSEISVTISSELATFDGPDLTFLIFCCIEVDVSVEVSGAFKGYTKLRFSDISWSFPYPTLMLRIQRGLRNPWLLASPDEATLTPPRALFILDLMTHGRARHCMSFPNYAGSDGYRHFGGRLHHLYFTLLATHRQPRTLFERWSKLFGGWTPCRRDFHPDAHPMRIERGASRRVTNGARIIDLQQRSRDLEGQVLTAETIAARYVTKPPLWEHRSSYNAAFSVSKTFEMNELFELVLLAHSSMVRVSLEGRSFGTLQMQFRQRTCREGACWERHPNLAQAHARFAPYVAALAGVVA
jgi:hypothetical protein